MTILFKIVDWNSGSETGTPKIFTTSSPNYPTSHDVTGNWAGRTQDNNAPWNGLYLLDCTGNWTYGAYTTVSSATAHATSGRILVQATPSSTGGNYDVFQLNVAADENDFRVVAHRTATTNIRVYCTWDQENQFVEIITTFPTNPYNLEVIYDTNAGTAANRLRMRTWDVGGTPGSFTDTASSSTAMTATQPTQFNFGSYNNGETYAKYGRIFIGDDTSEDLSTQLNDAVNFNPFFMFNI